MNTKQPGPERPVRGQPWGWSREAALLPAWLQIHHQPGRDLSSLGFAPVSEQRKRGLGPGPLLSVTPEVLIYSASVPWLVSSFGTQVGFASACHVGLFSAPQNLPRVLITGLQPQPFSGPDPYHGFKNQSSWGNSMSYFCIKLRAHGRFSVNCSCEYCNNNNCSSYS